MPADEVVVVVSDPGLVASRMSGGLDAPDQSRATERREHVVRRLDRDAADPRDHLTAYLVRRDVAVGVVKGFEYREARRGHTQAGADQSATGFTTTFTDQVFFYVPGQGSTEKIRLLGYSSDILNAKVIK